MYSIKKLMLRINFVTVMTLLNLTHCLVLPLYNEVTHINHFIQGPLYEFQIYLLFCLSCYMTDTSFESGMSDDYAVPPDALSCCGADTTSIESSMPSLLMRVSSYLDSPSKRVAGESLEKAGHLAKLGGKLKTWRKRWFVLRNGVLTYWKSQVCIWN